MLLAQEIATQLLRKPTSGAKETTEAEMAGKGLQAIEWLSYAMKLGESLREETRSLDGVGNVNEIKVCCLLPLLQLWRSLISPSSRFTERDPLAHRSAHTSDRNHWLYLLDHLSTTRLSSSIRRVLFD